MCSQLVNFTVKIDTSDFYSLKIHYGVISEHYNAAFLHVRKAFSIAPGARYCQPLT